MDVVTLGAVLNGSKKYTDQVVQSLMGGVHYRGSVSYYTDLPNDASEGDSYTVKYAGTSGSIADGTEYTWGYDTDAQDYAWISFSKDAYSKAETDALLGGKQNVIDSSHKLDGSLISPLTGYAKSQTGGQAVSPSDSLNMALGKVEKRVSDNETNILSVEGKMPILLAGRFPFSPDECSPNTLEPDGITPSQPKRMLTPIFRLPKNTRLRFAPAAHVGEYDDNGNLVQRFENTETYTATQDVFIRFAAKNSSNSDMGVVEYKELLHNIFIENVETLSTGYNYMGAPIHLGNYFVRTARNYSGNGQDGAIYNDFMFFCNENASCKVVQLSSQNTIATFYLDQYETIKPHCNTVVFGDKYEQTDKFPLLYVNAYNNTNLPLGTVYVHRITTNSRGIPTGTALIQTITIGFTNDSVWTDGNDVRPYGNFFVDTDNGYLYAYTLRDADNITRFFKFAIPDTTTSTVTLLQTDIVEQFDVPYIPYIQGNTYYNGKAYILSGLGTSNSNGCLYVVNLEMAKIISKVNFASTIGNLEPEFISPYYDKLIIGSSAAYEYTFS